MLSDIRYWEKKATEGHYAIPHFNVWNAEMLMGVIDAAEELRAPIIISFGTGFTGNTSFEDFCYMMDSMAKKATVPVIEHWDHGRNMTILQNAVNHCMNSVMRDASALPYEENVAEIKRCVDYFHAYNIPVEAELGHVGNETVYEEALSEYQYTDPSKAKEFVERTGCDSLAVAIGNVHGVYSSEPKLAFDVLEAVAKEVVGAVGIISVIAHVASNPMQQLVQAFDRGDITTARRLANQLAPLVHALNGDGYQAVMAKAALKVKGVIPSTTMRLPNIGPDATQLDKAEEGMRAAGLL